MRALVQVQPGHNTGVDLRERSPVVPSMVVTSVSRLRTAVSERIPALLSSDDYGSSVRYHLKLWIGFSDESAAYLPA